MSSLWISLLFQHGHIADPLLAQRLAGAEEMPPEPTPTPLTHGEAMRRLIAHGRRLSLRLCQGIGSGLVHMQ